MNCVEERNQTVMGLSGYAEALSKRASYRHGVNKDDAYQHIILEALVAWDRAKVARNVPAYLTAAMNSGIRDFLSMFYSDSRSLMRRAKPIEDAEGIAMEARQTDPLAVLAAVDACAGLSDKQRKTVALYFGADRSTSEIPGVSKSRAQVYVDDFVSMLQEKFGVDRVKRKEVKLTDTHIFVHDEHGEVSGSVSDVANQLGLDNGSLHRVVKNPKRSVKGWRFKRD